MQLYVKFFGKKSGALGISYYHTACLYAQSELVDDVRAACYACGYKAVTVLETSTTTPRELSWGEQVFNNTNGVIKAPHECVGG